jgi:hypothetical protein
MPIEMLNKQIQNSYSKKDSKYFKSTSNFLVRIFLAILKFVLLKCYFETEKGLQKRFSKISFLLNVWAMNAKEGDKTSGIISIEKRERGK